MPLRGGRVWTSVAVGSLLLAGCSSTDDAAVDDSVPEEIAAAGVLLAATDPTFPPAQVRTAIEFRGVQQGAVTGFEVELLEAAAAELGLEVRWVDRPFDEVLEEVTSGEADVAAAAITVTEERSDDFTFVTFFSTGTQWAVREPNAAGVTPASACGARVAVQAGTVAVDDLIARSAACEEDGDEPIDLLEFERQDEVTSSVLSGSANAFVADAPAVAWAVRQSGGTPNAASTVNTGRLATVGPAYDEAPYGWAVTDEQLAEALLSGLQAVVDSGDYGEILESWNVSDGALSAEEIVLLSDG